MGGSYSQRISFTVPDLLEDEKACQEEENDLQNSMIFQENGNTMSNLHSGEDIRRIITTMTIQH